MSSAIEDLTEYFYSSLMSLKSDDICMTGSTLFFFYFFVQYYIPQTFYMWWENEILVKEVTIAVKEITVVIVKIVPVYDFPLFKVFQ